MGCVRTGFNSQHPDQNSYMRIIGKHKTKIFRAVIPLYKNKKLLLASVIFTLPSILIWSFGTVSYLWSLTYKYIFINFSLKSQMLLLLIIPFTASTLSLIDFIRTRSRPSKILFILNLFFIVMVIFTSLLLG